MMNATYSYNDLSKVLAHEFPELEARILEESDWWGKESPGPHIVYGDIFAPYIEALLVAGDDQRAERAFELIESLLKHPDLKVQEVAVVTVLEYLSGKPSGKPVIFKLAERFMGDLALRAIKDLAAC